MSSVGSLLRKFICIVWLDLAQGSEYCSRLSNNPSPDATSHMCRRSTVTGQEVYVDSAGVPRFEDVYCTCMLTSNARKLLVKYHEFNELSKNPFRIDGSTLEDDDSTTIEIEDEEPITITFTQTSEDGLIAGCLMVAIHDQQPPASQKHITVECFPEVVNNDGTLGDTDRTGIIVGASLGGCVIVIGLVAVAIVLHRKKNRNNIASSTPKQTDSTVAEKYVKIEKSPDTFESAVPPVRRKPSGAYTEIQEYDVIQEPGGAMHVYSTTPAGEYNQLGAVTTRHTTDNVYNKLSNNPDPSQMSGERKDDEYNRSDNTKRTQINQTGNVYDKTH